MGVDLLSEDADYRISNLGTNDPATDVSAGGFLGYGVWPTLGAGVQGAVGGVAAASRTVMDAVDTANTVAGVSYFGSSLSPLSVLSKGYGLMTDTYEETSGQSLRDQMAALERWSKIDQRKVGTGGQVLGGVTRGLTVFGIGTLAGGPVAGASLLGGTEGYQTFRDMTAEGVDSGTALGAAAVVGATSFAGGLLPASVGAKSLLGMAASGAAINTGFGMASRGAVSAVLEANGYTKMADQYRMLDGEALAADLILGAAFGGWARFSDRGGAAKPTKEEIIAALEARRRAENARGTVGIPTDIETAKLDAELSDRAVAAILSGQPIQIDGSEAQRVVDGSIADPQKAQLHETYVTALREELGDLAAISTPEDVVAEPVSPPKPETAPPQPPEQAEALKDIDPVIAEQINDLSALPENATIKMPDNRVIPASKLREQIIENLAMAEKDSNLFDVAVACFLRTE